jgi:hypothetical protein
MVKLRLTTSVAPGPWRRTCREIPTAFMRTKAAVVTARISNMSVDSICWD